MPDADEDLGVIEQVVEQAYGMQAVFELHERALKALQESGPA